MSLFQGYILYYTEISAAEVQPVLSTAMLDYNVEQSLVIRVFSVTVFNKATGLPKFLFYQMTECTPLMMTRRI